MVEATTHWPEPHPVNHATAQKAVLGVALKGKFCSDIVPQKELNRTM